MKSTWVCAVQTRYEGASDSAFISLVAPVPLHFIVNISWEKIYVITPYTLLSLAYWRYFPFIFFIHVFSHMLLVLLIYSLFKGLHWVKKNKNTNFLFDVDDILILNHYHWRKIQKNSDRQDNPHKVHFLRIFKNRHISSVILMLTKILRMDSKISLIIFTLWIMFVSPIEKDIDTLDPPP